MRFRKAIAMFILCIAVAFVFFDIAKVAPDSDSMAPTMMPSDRFLYFRYARPAQFGIFNVDDPVDEKSVLVKRIIGLPGDKILIYDHSLLIPPEHYFVMGDHREVSRDSRTFGPVHKTAIHERAVAVIWPPNHVRWLW